MFIKNPTRRGGAGYWLYPVAIAPTGEHIHTTCNRNHRFTLQGTRVMQAVSMFEYFYVGCTGQG